MEEQKVNQFSSTTTRSSPRWDMPKVQAQFPRFNDAKLDPPAGATADDIRKRIEDAKSNGWGAQLIGLLGSNKVRIAIVLVIIGLFSAGSYISKFQKPSEESAKSSAAISQPITESEGTTNVFDIKLDNHGGVVLKKADGDSGLLARAEEDPLSITKTANAGEGITHLARRALTDYLAETGKSLNAEQKIYAEDYVQSKTGDEWLEIGQKLSFLRNLLREAVQEAEGLEQWQIENLKQYTVNISLL